MVIFADDFIITGKSKEMLENEVKPLVENFLRERGLELSDEKTKITHIENGFDFLGQNVRKYKGKLLTKPSKKNIKNFLNKVRTIIKGNKQTKTENLIKQLNPILKGWANYHRHAASKQTFSAVDHAIVLTLWQWAKRRHPNKSHRWIKDKYFCQIKGNRWMFYANVTRNDETPTKLLLFRAASMPIKRHIKIRGEANPYDPQWEEYFEERTGLQMLDNLRDRKKLLRLWFEQDGICSICFQKITKESGWAIHHIVRRIDGGKDTINNLVLLHPNCHRQVHNQKVKVSKPRPLKRR
jgi:RNA-directed DNA polymerase